jgi:hypothetical protein
MQFPRAILYPEQFFEAISNVPLPEGVISLTPRLGTDWYGDDVVYIEVIFDDGRVPKSKEVEFMNETRKAILFDVGPMENWGVAPNFRFLTKDEYARKAERVFA